MSADALAAERFTAWCPCPRCGVVDCHPWREPLQRSPEEMMRRIIMGQQSLYLEPHRTGPVERPFLPLPVSESGFEVIRQCKCGQEWGVAP